MARNTENIEAQLAAYIDGELDATERAELEKHLANNPEHRQLIKELLAMRDELRALPHETAPADISEMMQGQLERSALLDGPSVAMHGRLRISRWPQMAALAAILFLTVGLAVVVYLVLFPARPASFTIAPGRQPTADEERHAEASGGTGTGVGALQKEFVASSGLKSAPDNESKQDRELFGRDAGKVATGGGADQLLAQTTQPAREPVVLVVSTDNPQAAKTEVANYLVSNGIAWQPVSEPMPEPLNFKNSQIVEGARFRGQTRVSKSAALNDTNSAEADQQNVDVTAAAPLHQSQALGQGAPAPGAATTQESQQPLDSFARRREAAVTLANSNSQIEPGDDLIVARGVTQAQYNQLALSLGRQKVQQSARLLSQAGSVNGDGKAGGEDILKDKAKDLANTLNSKPNSAPGLVENRALELQAAKPSAAGSTTQNSEREKAFATTSPTGTAANLAANAAPATQPQAILDKSIPLNKNDMLIVSVSDLAGPGMDTVVRTGIANDGTVTLPPLGKVGAVGLTPPELEEFIAQKCRESNLVANASVTVRRLDVDTKSRPELAEAKKATSQDAADDRVDVLILLRNNASPSATQPSQFPSKAAAPSSQPTLKE